MSEYGLVVIWHNYLDRTNEILDVISKKFKILDCYEIEWSKELLYQNFYRFYGERLATSEIKRKSSKGHKLRLIIFKDLEPKYGFKATIKGIEKTNINLLNTKNFIRHNLNTSSGIHGSHDEIEVHRDLSLLLGINLDDYKKKKPIKKQWDGSFIKLKRDITGTNHWKSFEEFFYFINAVDPYVILKNKDTILNFSEEENINFLVHDITRFAYFTNAKKLSKGTQRVNFQIEVGEKKVSVNFRYISAGYFDECLQRDCMLMRKLNNDNIYVLDKDNSYYFLAYHLFIHKREFLQKHLEYFNSSTIDELKNKLYTFMYDKHYAMVVPNDITLNFNKKYGGNLKFSRARRVRNSKGFLGTVKKIFYTLNNLIHFRRGPV